MNGYVRSAQALWLVFLLALSLVAVHADAAASSRGAGLFTVDTTTDENDGSCTDGDCSLRDAILAADSGASIVFAPALSGDAIKLDMGQLEIDRDLTVDGSDLASHVKISGAGSTRVLTVWGGATVTLQALDVIDGSAGSGGGGGIRNLGHLTVSGCQVRDSQTTGNGGGIWNGGVLSIAAGTVIARNHGEYGGGIRNDGALSATDAAIIGNTADFGGGIDNYAGSMALVNVEIEDNAATHYGGGVTTGAPATMTDSIIRGNTAESGGGIDSHVAGATLVLTGCTLAWNTAHLPAGYGGALNNDEASVEVHATVFDRNGADVSGGGIYNGMNGAITIYDSSFVGNTATSTSEGYGGAIGNSGVLALSRSTFMENTARWNGGAIENWSGDLTATDCTFAANHAANGGAINNNMASTLTAEGSTFRGNAATDGGGVFYNDNGSSLTLENCTLSANSAGNDGGGIFNTLGEGADSPVTLSNVTLYGNAGRWGGGIYNAAECTLNYFDTIIAGSVTGGDCVNDGLLSGDAGNLVEDGSCSPTLDGDPGLAPLADNGGPTETHALQAGSQAIDAGNDAACQASDQRGVARPAAGVAGSTPACDIGAFEAGDVQAGIQSAPEPQDYAFAGATARVISDGKLDCLRVTEIPSNHPSAPPSLRTGRYWQIEALELGCDTPADGYEIDLTLPYAGADEDSRVCRWMGEGWDCAADGYGTGWVQRLGITELSDWTAGSGDCGAAGMPEPDIALAGTLKRDVGLSWENDPANAGGYSIHRSESPYFSPAAASLLTTLPPGAKSHKDIGAGGLAGARYFYIVRGLSNCGEPSDYGAPLGVFTFGLAPGQ